KQHFLIGKKLHFHIGVDNVISRKIYAAMMFSKQRKKAEVIAQPESRVFLVSAHFTALLPRKQ
ncbi:hypothetical protein, partial [Liquorilactobacillus satsumensis]|uniref:hypothetical protein n=1 Tax=Liquorilactobacillus satsumensis TaxID=259059 RepID=UPI0039EABDC6